MNYCMLFKLTNFIGSRVEVIESEDGVREECVIIPIDRNHLRRTNKKHIYCIAFVNQAHRDIGYNATHNIVQKFPYEAVKKLNQMGYKSIYLGLLTEDKNKNELLKKKK